MPADAMADGNDALESAARRRPITFTNKVIGTNTDFPVWLDITNNDLKQRAHANDIYFTDSDGTTKLDRQIMAFDQATGHLQAWVRVPTLANGSKIYLDYGDPGPVNAENAPAVFIPAGYKAVWHFEALDANVADATNQTNATGTFTTATTLVPGQLGNGLQWTNGSDKATFTNPLLGTSPHTISAWVYQNQNVTHTSAILNLGTPAPNQSRWLYGHFAGSTWYVGFYGDDTAANDSLEDNHWHLVTWVYPGTGTGVSLLYTDGAQASMGTATGVDTQGTAGVIGHAPEDATGYGLNNAFEGKLDELRIANVAHDASWIKTEFNNQSNPGTFIMLGGEQSPPF